MKYVMRSNTLFDEKNNKRAYIHASASYLKSVIRSENGEIINAELRMNSSYDAHKHEYVMTDNESNVIASARPRYSKDEDPDQNGWPLNRAPLVDEASLTIRGGIYKIIRVGYPKYEIRDSAGRLMLGTAYSPLMKNWNIYASKSLSPEIICAIVIFCKYLEFENDAVIL